ncbi:MAG: DUF86 domain-containing protein [Chloroflexi bacterium]|nr:DUF86 domain-containing protein [Chloroflexota bacterium]
MLTSISDIVSFTENMTFESFKEDKKTIYAVTRCIEIMGEATRKIPKSIRDKYPSIPWTRMAGMRNIMIHEYFGIDVKILWKTVREDIPSLKPVIQDLVRKFG